MVEGQQARDKTGQITNCVMCHVWNERFFLMSKFRNLYMEDDKRIFS